jgi:chromosome segregation protein
MRLRKMKMAGFKSFVDPTTLTFPSEMVGIVGPNGCGKSNIVDAIRWVMGASSKNIRGDTLEDVIFKGSSNRKPVGQASIELVFDNSEGKAGGQYASYSEIAVRRQVSRDGQSKYYLNGSPCRRRDVSDIFLGTGLGPRSYAIIEQGTISRLIDAKPEEMRAHLEEAAGISKYKERRRETENRIRHTRENLDRLHDLIEEVDKQITKLKRQASAAERYKVLKAEERRARAELVVLRLKLMDENVKSQHQLVESKETQLEQTIAQLRALEAEIEQSRQSHAVANEAMNKVQGDYYQIGADISRLEQSIQHANETKQRYQGEQQQAQQNLVSLQNELSKEQLAQQSFDQQIEQMMTELNNLNEQYNVVGEAVISAEQAEKLWRQAWDQLIEETNEPSHQVEVYSQKIQFIDQEIARLQDRQVRTQSEHADLIENEHDIDLHGLEMQVSEREKQVQESKFSLESIQQEIIKSRQSIDAFVKQIDDSKAQQQKSQSQLTRLQALQDAALKGEGQELKEWLGEHEYAQLNRLAEFISVESGWERAAETVLEGFLDALCINDLDQAAHHFHGLQKGSVTFYQRQDTSSTQPLQGTLASKVTTDLAITHELQNILIAETLEQALNMRKNLQAGQSVVTPQGMWFGEHWVRYSNAVSASEGVLSRKAEIADLQKALNHINEQYEDLNNQHKQSVEKLSQQEKQREEIQQKHNQAFQQAAEKQAELIRSKESIEHWQQRDTQLRHFIDEAQKQLLDYQQQRQQAEAHRDAAQSNLSSLQARKQELMTRKEQVVVEFDNQKQQANHLQERRHALQLEIEANRTRAATSQSIVSRLSMQQSELEQRCSDLVTLVSESAAPIDELSSTLAQTLERRLEVESQLLASRKQVEAIEADIRTKDEQRLATDNKINDEREILSQQRMKWQELTVRMQTLQEQLEQYEWSLEQLKNEMPEQAQESEWQQKVDSIEEKIKRLGSINLAAIDEFKEQSERKEYLDAQDEDLTKALDTLESAIRKIDRETKERFKETFDQVNTHIQRMYPRLFPGGKAYLEMSGDDLLTAGVVIMARPPGKRVSSIQLLSGGEKALTAAALVLAIFELNPAPFCLLDEVDAPLDDANVGRFCDLIKDMSQHVQFIFITHNKSSMSYANHMLGVTMNEPGVSRLVSVDIDAAAELAGVS